MFENVKYILMNNIINNKNKLIVSIFYLFWLSLILSINTKPDELSLIGQGFIQTINSLRLIIPLIISIIFIILTFFLILKTKKKTEHPFYFFYLWLAYFFIQILAEIMQLDILIADEKNIFFSFLGLGTTCLFILVNYFKIKIENFLKILLATITLVSFALLILYLIQNGIKENFILHQIIDPNFFIFNQPLQRITGLTRILSILNIYLILTFLLKPKHKIFYFILITIISTIIFLAEARGTVVCYFLCIVYLIFFLIKKNFRDKVLLIVILIMFPFFIYLLTKFYNKPFSKVNTNSEYTLNILEKNSDILEGFKNTRYLINHTSGRLEIWEELLKKYNYKNIIGYGPQADRKLLKTGNPLSDKYGNNASNAFIYAFICGGYLGLFFFALINYKIIKATIDLVIIKKMKNIFFYKLSLLYLVYFLVRQIFENSFSLFSIDFLLVMASFSISHYFKKNYKESI
jgi:hypothetical protein